MEYVSPIHVEEFVVDELNWRTYCPPPDIEGNVQTLDGKVRCTGRKPRDWSVQPFGSIEVMQPFDVPLIGREHWPEMIKEREMNKRQVSDLCLLKAIPSKDQSQTNFCWTNAIVTILEMLRAIANEPYVELSPASVAAMITNFSNQGGWGGDALEYITKHGIAPASLWPCNYWQGPKYNTPATQAERVKYTVTEWYDMENRNFDQMMTLLLLNMPVGIGLNWWSHEIAAIDPVMTAQASAQKIRDMQVAFKRTLNCDSNWSADAVDRHLEAMASQFGSRCRNSWGDSYGNKGFFILTEAKSTADDQCAPRVIRAYPGSVSGQLASAV